MEPEFFSQRLREISLVQTANTIAHTNNPTESILANYPIILNLMGSMSHNEVFGPNPLMGLLTESFCSPFPFFCLFMNEVSSGEQNPWIDNEDAFVSNSIRGTYGTSVKVLQHFFQSARSGQATYFDYGSQVNLETYGSETPPPIPFEDTENDIGIFASSIDASVSLEDNEEYIDVIGDNLVLFNQYDITHLSFVIGRDMSFLEDIDDFFSEYQMEQCSDS